MWNKILGLLLSVGAVILTLKIMLYIAMQDKEGSCYSLKMTPVKWLLCLISGQVAFISAVGCVKEICGRNIWGSKLWLTYTACILLSVLAGSLLMACITDCQNCLVFHFVWWVGGMAGLVLLTLTCHELWCGCEVSEIMMAKVFFPKAISLLAFGLLQEKIFIKMYGRADCHAFVVCALAECAVGLGIREYLLHMLSAFSLLAVVQAMKGNIGKSGNLKEAVPFLPYITVSFWLIVMAM